MENEKSNAMRSVRNIAIASMALNNSNHFRELANKIGSGSNLKSFSINYEKVLSLSEFIDQNASSIEGIKKSKVMDNIYVLPVIFEYAAGENGSISQMYELLMDDYLNAIAVIPHDSGRNDATNLENFRMLDSYNNRCLNIARELQIKGYSDDTIRAVLRITSSKDFKDFAKIVEEQGRTAPLDIIYAEALASRYEDLRIKEGYTPEQLNQIKIDELLGRDEQIKEKDPYIQSKNVLDLASEEPKEDIEDPTKLQITSDVPPTEEVEEEGTSKVTEEEEASLPTTIEKSKLAKIIEKSDVPISQIQDIIIIPHPMELNRYLPGDNIINNNEEVVLIKFRGGATPSRFQIMQGEGENLTKVEVHGKYNEELQEIFPEKSTIGAHAYKIQEAEDDVVEVNLTCDGKAQRINLSNVPVSERLDLVQNQLLMKDFEEIQRKGEIEIRAAQSIIDPVEREKALADAHKSIADDIEVLQAPGYDDDNAVKTHMAEITEHLAAAKEAEAEKIKAEEEAAAAAAAEEEAKEVPEEEQVSEAAKTMLSVGGKAVAVAAGNTLNDDNLNSLLSGVDDGNVNKLPEHDDHSEGRGERTITPPNYPYV